MATHECKKKHVKEILLFEEKIGRGTIISTGTHGDKYGRTNFTTDQYNFSPMD